MANRTIQKLLDDADDWLLIEVVVDSIEEASGPIAEDAANAEQRIVLLVQSAVGHISCGGMECFFHESVEDFQETVAAFETIGAMESASMLRSAASVFPGGKPQEDLGERERYIKTLTPAQKEVLERSGRPLNSCGITPALGTYIRTHAKAFLELPPGLLDEPLSGRGRPMTPPRVDASSREVAAWLLSRRCEIECSYPTHPERLRMTLLDEGPIPDGPFAIAEVAFEYYRRDNAETLRRLAAWNGVGSIESIALEDSRLSGAELSLLASFPSLRRLDITGLRVPDSDLGALAGLRSLEELHLTDVPNTDAALAPLPELRVLELMKTEVRGIALASFKRLRELTVAGSPMDGDLPFLTEMAELESLSLHGIAITRKAIENIASRRRLKSLLLWDSGLSEDALASLAGHEGLESVHLQGMKLGSVAGKVLLQIPNLQEFRVGDVEKPRDLYQILKGAKPSLILPDA
jgi:hypothetical protein